MIQKSKKVICAWGSWPFIEKRAMVVEKLIRAWGKEPYCLGTNMDRSPKHPLYLKANTQPFVYGKVDEGEIKNIVDHISNLL